jgi:hypothetical protein
MYASSPLLYILRVSLLFLLLVSSPVTAVLLSISVVDNSTPSDTILTYSSASAVSSAVVAIWSSAALLTDSSPFFNSCLASDRFFSTSSNPFAISSPSFG